jgi:hypothetical protein
MDASVAAIGQTQILGLRFWIFAWYVILLMGALGLLGAWAWGRRTGWRNRDEVVRGFGTILLSIGMLFLLTGTALKLGAGLVGLATVTFIVAFLQCSRLKRPPLRIVREEGVARARFS